MGGWTDRPIDRQVNGVNYNIFFNSDTKYIKQ